ncbi:Uncharacterised protein [Mycobacteroides abscessus subsp. massiliense]|nr:Uncharacterised protein [Mycobacteroides abscessus subsp. massiliense]
MFEQLAAVRVRAHLVIGAREDGRLHTKKCLVDVPVVLGVDEHPPGFEPGGPGRAVGHHPIRIRVFGQVVGHTANNRQIN